jgi:hypothetical protein
VRSLWILRVGIRFVFFVRLSVMGDRGGWVRLRMDGRLLRALAFGDRGPVLVTGVYYGHGVFIGS